MPHDLKRQSLTTWLLDLEALIESVEKSVQTLSARLDALEAPKPIFAPEAELWSAEIEAAEKGLRTVSKTR